MIYQRTNKLEKAIGYFETSLKVKKRHYLGGHLSVAETMNQLATAYVAMGRTDEAEPLFEVTLSMFEKRYGAHMNTASVLDSLGAVTLAEGKLEESYCYLERALAVKRLVDAEDEVATSETLFLIGKVQTKSGDADDALDTFKEGKSSLFYFILCMRKIEMR